MSVNRKLVYLALASAAVTVVVYPLWGTAGLADQSDMAPAASDEQPVVTPATDTPTSKSAPPATSEVQENKAVEQGNAAAPEDKTSTDGGKKPVQTENKKVTEGMAAPDFTLSSQTGATVSLHDYIGKNPVVLYFYPKDETPVCTKEACSFRDNIETFKDLDATVIGISADSVESHKKFAEKYNLPFILVSDEDNAVRKLYGVPKTMGLMPGRVTYVIGKDGTVRHVFASQLDAEKHVTEAVASLKQQDTTK